MERRLRLGETAGMSEIESEDVLDDIQEERARHVVMCDTLRPPPSPDCTRKCLVKTDTVSTLFAAPVDKTFFEVCTSIPPFKERHCCE